MKSTIMYTHIIENTFTNELPDSMPKWSSLLYFKSMSSQSINLSIPGILSNGIKLNEHVDDFIPDKNLTILLGIYALVNKVNRISWNCFKVIQNVWGDDMLATEENKAKLKPAAAMTWVVTCAFSVPWDITYSSVCWVVSKNQIEALWLSIEK